MLLAHACMIHGAEAQRARALFRQRRPDERCHHVGDFTQTGRHCIVLNCLGFYYCATFHQNLAPTGPLYYPAKSNNRPKVLRTPPKKAIIYAKSWIPKTIRPSSFGFICRSKGVSSMLLGHPLCCTQVQFPASELANLYHMRWDIETFYRAFKHTLRATSWHCHTPTPFPSNLITLSLIFLRT